MKWFRCMGWQDTMHTRERILVRPFLDPMKSHLYNQENIFHLMVSTRSACMISIRICGTHDLFRHHMYFDIEECEVFRVVKVDKNSPRRNSYSQPYINDTYDYEKSFFEECKANDWVAYSSRNMASSNSF